jgi:hypothetical protein
VETRHYMAQLQHLSRRRLYVDLVTLPDRRRAIVIPQENGTATVVGIVAPMWHSSYNDLSDEMLGLMLEMQAQRIGRAVRDAVENLQKETSNTFHVTE